MKVVQLKIENYRGIQSADLKFDGHALLVGSNNVGKSTGEFDRVKASYTFEGDVVWRLTRKVRKKARLRRADLSILPNEIFLRESLLAP